MEIQNLLKRNYQNEGLALLRISFGLMLVLLHGWPTVKAFLEGITEYPDPLGLGSRVSMGLMGFAEFVCAILVVLGLFTRISLIPLILGFFAAFFIFHANDAFAVKELAFHYLLVFVVLLITGPGTYTLPYFFQLKKSPK